MRCLAYVAVFGLAACATQHADPKVRAERCVSDRVKGDTKVSAAHARELVDKCQQAVTEWLDATMLHACRGACDYSDPRNVKERLSRKEAIEVRLMMRVSDEVHPRVVRM